MKSPNDFPLDYKDREEYLAVMRRVKRLTFGELLISIAKNNGIVFDDESGLTKQDLINIVDKIPKADLLKNLDEIEGRREKDTVQSWTNYPPDYKNREEYLAVTDRIEQLTFKELLTITKKNGIVFSDEGKLVKQDLVSVADEIPKIDLLRELDEIESRRKK